MRPQQQNRRMRGRNNNRKGPNPLTRSYESNGPDVKIRGSAQQVADKYAALARDAQSAGDRVMAENYLQHAEHYNRIIAAAQGQMPQNASRDQRDDDDDDSDDRQEASQNNNNNNQPQANAEASQQQRRQDGDDGSGPQPVIEGTPVEVALEQESMKSDDGEKKRGRRSNGAPQKAQSNGEGGDGEEAPRRARRPRRPRNRDGETGEATASAEHADGGEGAQPAPGNEADDSVPAAAQ
ncbi:DUF4167 domain-containing protein [Nitratireductor mangrovi]|uniref:DUF4167 domain-containing protein n=1 Tax=Nitratireductor mangrovi TaxID=2599600 RepID=A0A5B8L0X9_9HYPH|nr:DUF4167 domain-containing protein [Nitratireductor mangrovi]